MRIRKSASRLLGSTYSVPAAPAPDVAHPFDPVLTSAEPMQFQAPCSAPESLAGSSYSSPATATASGETCELSRSPWDLIAELSISDPQVEDDLVDKYFVSVACRASWLFPDSMPVTSVKKEKEASGGGTVGAYRTTQQPRHEAPRKAPKKLAVRKEKESEPMKKAKVKKEEEEQEVKQPTYQCKKNDGKSWFCRRSVSQPNSYCKYHLYQKRAYLNPEFAAEANMEAEVEMKKVPQPPVASKPSTTSKHATCTKSSSISKPRKKKPRHDFGASEGFYYYAGFGPFRSKRQGRISNGMNESVPQQKQEEEEESAQDDRPTKQQAPVRADDDPDRKAATYEHESSCDDADNIAGIAGGDEESSDDDYRLGVAGRSMNGNGEHSDGKRKNGWKKRWRKPVKARSLKSLM